MRRLALRRIVTVGWALLSVVGGCKSAAVPEVVTAIGIAQSPRPAIAQTLAGEQAKQNLMLLLRPEGTPFVYVRKETGVEVHVPREGRASTVRTEYRSVAKDTWLAEAKASRSQEVVDALGLAPFVECDVTLRDSDLVRAYQRAEASLFRALVERALGTRVEADRVTGRVKLIDLTSEVGDDWIRLGARARVEFDKDRSFAKDAGVNDRASAASSE